MSRYDKTIQRLMEIAKNCTESDFQRNKQYLKFKFKKNINRNEIDLMIAGLDQEEFNFPEERIYWNKRGLEEKGGDKQQRYIYFHNLIHLYHEVCEYELVLEYGQKALAWIDSNKKKKFWEDFSMLECLTSASQKLKRFEESLIYGKKCVLYQVKWNKYKSITDPNEKTKREWYLLQCYEKLIQSQLEMNCTEDVMKTFRAIKTFKLDSMNPQDVADCYQKSVTGCLEVDDTLNMNLVGLLCQMKGRALYKLGDQHYGKKWFDLAVLMCDLLYKGASSVYKRLFSCSAPEEFLEQLVYITITVVELEPTERIERFHKLMLIFFSETTVTRTQIKDTVSFIKDIDTTEPQNRRQKVEELDRVTVSNHASRYIGYAITNRFAKFETVLPFIEHFIICCDEMFLKGQKTEFKRLKKTVDPNLSLEDQKMKMVAYKNSLLIAKHFNALY